ncbi:MAG: lactonase family protein [Acetobacteraceae bacterium]|nr:lactonase family protein [Acetobacteraceae bacterium]
MVDGLAFVGCFTTAQRKARGKGIDVYRANPDLGAWQATDHVPDLVNPSFLITDPARHVLYSVHGDSDFASAFSIDGSAGKLRLLGRAATGGKNGVHPALDPSGRFLIVANYASGTLAVLPVRQDGSLADFTQLVALPGEIGPHRTEQPCAHPHHVVFDPSGRFVIVPDKGVDRVFVLSFDPERGQLAITQQVAMRPGAGPRHIVFHPHLPFAFLVNELDSTVATLRWNSRDGILDPVHVVSTLPSDFFGASTAAEIAITPDGNHVYVSNRGQDGIVRCRFIAAEGRLDVVGWTQANGRDPRFMTLSPSGKSLLVASEQGDKISAFHITAQDGNLTPSGSVLPTASPCTIAFI